MPAQRISLIWSPDPTLYAPAKYRRACRYEAFVPALLSEFELAIDPDTMGMISHAERAIGRLNAFARPALVPLARVLLRTESIASSKVEGLQIDTRALARAEARVEAGQQVGPSATEILANIDAMQLAVDEAAVTERFTVEQLTVIHERLRRHGPGASIAGQIRTSQNWIGGNDYNPCGAAFVPPPPEYVSPLLDDLCDAVNDETLPPLVQAALVLAQLEIVHPFVDGNGRTGRALVQVVLRRRGLAPDYVPPISVALANAGDAYIAGLTDFRSERAGAWIAQFAAAAARAATLAEAYLQRVDALTESWRNALRAHASPRADAAAWSIIDVLPAHPVISAPVAAAVTRRTKPAIYTAIGQLVEAGVLEPLTTSRRHQAWEATGLLDLLAEFEAGRSPGTGG